MKLGLYPLVLEPLMAEKSWGQMGASIFFDPKTPTNLNLGEIWLTADGNPSVKISGGPQAGRTLARLRHLWGTDLSGIRNNPGPDTPLGLDLKLGRTSHLAKTSIVVNPDKDSISDLFPNAKVKDKAFYIISAEEDSGIYLGLNPIFTEENLKEELGNPDFDWQNFLNFIPVDAGETFVVPAGIPHALSKGLVWLEVSPRSIAQLCLHDWERLGPLGLKKPTQFSKALKAIRTHFTGIAPSPAPEIVSGEQHKFYLAATPDFALKKIIIEGHYSDFANGEYYSYLLPISGHGRLRSNTPTPATRLFPGRAVLIPAGIGRYTIESKQSLHLLKIWPPNLEKEVINPILKSHEKSNDFLLLAGPNYPKNPLKVWF